MLAAYMVSHLTFILFLSVAPAEHAGEAADYKVLVTSHCCKNCYTGLPRSCANCGCLLRAMAAVGSDAVSDEITIHTETDKATGQAASADVQVKATPEVVKRLKDSVTKRGDFLFTSSGNVEDENLTLECVGFAENDEAFSHDAEDDHTNKRNKMEFETKYPRNTTTAGGR